MEYKVEYTAGAVKTLRKIDKPIMALIYGWIEKILLVVEIQGSMVKHLWLITGANGVIVLVATGFLLKFRILRLPFLL